MTSACLRAHRNVPKEGAGRKVIRHEGTRGNNAKEGRKGRREESFAKTLRPFFGFRERGSFKQHAVFSADPALAHTATVCPRSFNSARLQPYRTLAASTKLTCGSAACRFATVHWSDSTSGSHIVKVFVCLFSLTPEALVIVIIIVIHFIYAELVKVLKQALQQRFKTKSD